MIFGLLPRISESHEDQPNSELFCNSIMSTLLTLSPLNIFRVDIRLEIEVDPS